MTRKDYVKLSQAISEATAKLSTVTDSADSWRVAFSIIDEVAKTLKADNANFDTDRFKDACWMVKV